VAKGLKAPRITGDFTPQVALARLLDDSGLRFEYLDADTVAIFAQGQGTSAALGGALEDPVRVADGAASPIRKAEGPMPQDSTAGAGEAGKQEETGRIEEIVVTAQKRSERALDVPISLVTFTGKELEARHITNLDDLQFAVPGMWVQDSTAELR